MFIDNLLQEIESEAASLAAKLYLQEINTAKAFLKALGKEGSAGLVAKADATSDLSGEKVSFRIIEAIAHMPAIPCNDADFI